MSTVARRRVPVPIGGRAAEPGAAQPALRAAAKYAALIFFAVSC